MFTNYVRYFPLTPLGGCFIVGVGLAILVGAAMPRARMRLVGAGFGFGTLLIYVGLRPLSPGVPRAADVAIWSIPVAILIETIVFAIVMPRARRRGERAAGVATLVIVSAHFIIMLPAFGPLIACLSIAGLVNAWRGWRQPVSFGQLWFVDGLLKVLFGAAMIATAPVFS